MSIKYRTAKVGDVKNIQNVLSTTWLTTYPHLKQETIRQVQSNWHSTEHLSRQVKDKKYFFPIALAETEVVGIATTGMRDNGVVDLFRLYILPEHQNKGIGTTLLDMVEAQYQGASKIKVYVDVQNHKAISYYEYRGFKKIQQETEDSFGEVMTEWLMEKVL